MKRTIVGIAILGCLIFLSAPAVAGDAPDVDAKQRSRANEPPVDAGVEPPVTDRGLFAQPSPIASRVLDLLDDTVELTSTGQAGSWRSEVFDTTRYNRIGLRFSANGQNAGVICSVCWQYTRADECQPGLPTVSSSPSRIGRGRVPDVIPDLYIRPPFALGQDYTEVRGLKARVQCTVAVIFDDFGEIGDDPDIGRGIRDDYPFDLSAELVDVKVLLRRE